LFLTNCLAPRPLISIASLDMNDMNISTHIHCVIDIHWKIMTELHDMFSIQFCN
jgi:hypothetical protein